MPNLKDPYKPADTCSKEAKELLKEIKSQIEYARTTPFVKWQSRIGTKGRSKLELMHEFVNNVEGVVDIPKEQDDASMELEDMDCLCRLNVRQIGDRAYILVKLIEE